MVMSHEAGTRSAPLRFASLVPFLTLEGLIIELSIEKFEVVSPRAGARSVPLRATPEAPPS